MQDTEARRLVYLIRRVLDLEADLAWERKMKRRWMFAAYAGLFAVIWISFLWWLRG